MASTYIDQANAIWDVIGDRDGLADTNLVTTQTFIGNAYAAIETAVDALAAVGISFDLGLVNSEYVAPTEAAPAVPAFDDSLAAPILVDAVDPGTAEAVPTDPDLPVDLVIPTADSIAISQAKWDAAFERAAAQQDRITTAREWDAANLAAGMGWDTLSETQATLLAQAQGEGDVRTNENALVSAIEEAKALREDVIALLGPTIQAYQAEGQQKISNYQAIAQADLERFKVQNAVDIQVYTETNKVLLENYRLLMTEARENYRTEWTLLLDRWRGMWQTKTQSELARLEFEKLEYSKAVEPERYTAEFNLKKTEIAQKNANAELIDLAQIYAQITQSLYSAAPVGAQSNLGLNLSGDA